MPLAKYEQFFPNLCRRLRQTKAKGRTGQAYLLVGDDIDFLEGFAKGWAQTAACTAPNPDGAACGNCTCCTAFSHQAYPECYYLRPQSKSRRITVDDMRDFEYFLGLSARPGYLKIGIIVEAECLVDAAQNAFLKTLEEPPRNTLLLLLTLNPKLLLPTIRSRCQTLALLRNRQDFLPLKETGLFDSLSLLYRQAGASNGLRAAAAIGSILESLHSTAVDTINSQKDDSWKAVDDPKLKKQLEEEQVARIEAEYIRLRNSVTGAMHTWFLQRFLLAAGAERDSLPNPEIFDGTEMKLTTPEECEQDVKHVEEFIRCLSSNVNEALALDVMCLSISERQR